MVFPSIVVGTQCLDTTSDNPVNNQSANAECLMQVVASENCQTVLVNYGLITSDELLRNEKITAERVANGKEVIKQTRLSDKIYFEITNFELKKETFLSCLFYSTSDWEFNGSFKQLESLIPSCGLSSSCQSTFLQIAEKEAYISGGPLDPASIKAVNPFSASPKHDPSETKEAEATTKGTKPNRNILMSSLLLLFVYLVL